VRVHEGWPISNTVNAGLLCYLVIVLFFVASHTTLAVSQLSQHLFLLCSLPFFTSCILTTIQYLATPPTLLHFSPLPCYFATPLLPYCTVQCAKLCIPILLSSTLIPSAILPANNNKDTFSYPPALVINTLLKLQVAIDSLLLCYPAYVLTRVETKNPFSPFREHCFCLFAKIDENDETRQNPGKINKY
jgi:hypothetical protein